MNPHVNESFGDCLSVPASSVYVAIAESLSGASAHNSQFVQMPQRGGGGWRTTFQRVVVFN